MTFEVIDCTRKAFAVGVVAEGRALQDIAASAVVELVGSVAPPCGTGVDRLVRSRSIPGTGDISFVVLVRAAVGTGGVTKPSDQKSVV